jgi:hypothetical protein
MSTDGVSSGIRALASGCVVGIAVAISGCGGSLQNPDRLYPVSSEMTSLTDAQQLFVQDYQAALRGRSYEQARAIRNELIAQRKYAVDINYSQYEARLTAERQGVGFLSSTTVQGLTTAGALFTPASTTKILSGVAGAVSATRGYYDSEILLDQTLRTIQKQMRASRSRIAQHITARMTQNVVDYPLSAALSDLEDYYRAGTLTTGVIDTSTTVGIEEDRAKERELVVASLPAQARAAFVLRDPTLPIPQPVRLPPPPAGDPRFGPIERGLQSKQIVAFQKLVCVAQPNGRLGPRGSDTRKLIRDYLVRNKLKDASEDDVITDNDRLALIEELAAGKACKPNQ